MDALTEVDCDNPDNSFFAKGDIFDIFPVYDIPLKPSPSKITFCPFLTYDTRSSGIDMFAISLSVFEIVAIDLLESEIECSIILSDVIFPDAVATIFSGIKFLINSILDIYEEKVAKVSSGIFFDNISIEFKICSNVFS